MINVTRYCETENTRLNKLNFGAHTKDTPNGPVCIVTAIVLFFHQKVDIQNIQKIRLPFQTSDLDLFPSDALFIQS